MRRNYIQKLSYMDEQIENLNILSLLYQLQMSQFNRFRELFKQVMEKGKGFGEYWKKSPSTKFIILNVGVYCLWKLKFIPQEFLVKHFAAQKFNIQEGRFHTLLTSSISHRGIFSLFFDVLMIGLMGRAIQMNCGPKYIYWLYGLGALFGGVTTSVFQPPSPYIRPQVGAESVIAAYLTFIALLNPHQTFLFFVFPVKAWILVFCLGFYSLLFDPHKKSFAGITAGVTVHQMMRARFI